MRRGFWFAGGLLVLAGAVATAQAPTYEVVLRGGEVIKLKEPLTVKGSNAILTRVDGTLLSVPVSEIDKKATAARASAPPPPPPAAAVTPPPSTPAEAVRASKDRPHARVRITDEDVGHQAVADETPSADKTASSASAVTGAKLEVADFSQDKSGSQFAVRGSLRNVGATGATNIRLTVSLLDDKGNVIAKRDAGLENTVVEAGQSSPFTAVFDVGSKNVASLRFQPIWIGVPPPPPVGAQAAQPSSGASSPARPVANGAPAAAASSPAPAPTPYGRGLFYAPGPPSATSTEPADHTNGYIPGAARPEDQPKPPDPD